MTGMRILTVRQPWAWAIIHGGKNIESRSQNIAGDYRGPIAIHAGLSYDSAWTSRTLDDAMQDSGARRRPGDPPWQGDLGAIIGTAELAGVHHAHSCPTYAQDAPWPLCSGWADSGDLFHLALKNPRPLPDPIPYRGALGLRRLDTDTFTQITTALAACYPDGTRKITSTKAAGRKRQPRSHTETASCVRCGIWRCIDRRRPSWALCRDCRAVLTEDEQKAWYTS